MIPRRQAELMNYYVGEMTYLRESGAQFAANYPHIAATLGISGTPSADPHMERLLESFAYLTANLRKNMDDQFPRIAETLMDTIYPQFTSPVPSMAIATLGLPPASPKLTGSTRIPAGTLLSARQSGETLCRFQTSWDTVLWPIRLEGATIVKLSDIDLGEALPPTSLTAETKLLQISLAAENTPLSALSPESFRFYIDLPPTTLDILYHALFLKPGKIILQGDDGDMTILDGGHLRPRGFDPEEAILPNGHQVHPAYTLLLEYFTFAQKFHFFELTDLPPLTAQKTLKIFVELTDDAALKNLPHHLPWLRMNCVPVINLFSKTSEPIRLDGTRIEYPLLGDARRPDSTEIYQIKKVLTTTDARPETLEVMPYFSFNHAAFRQDQSVFWFARRLPATSARGTDMLLSFVDFTFTPNTPDVPTLYAQLLCTNRHAAEQLSAGTVLQGEEAASGLSIQLLTAPTPQLSPQFSNGAGWRMISHLALNHISLANATLSTAALQEMLRLYASVNTTRTFPEIDGILRVDCAQCLRRVPGTPWPSFASGTSVHLQFDLPAFQGASLLIFSEVIRRFLTLYTSLNSFIEMQISTHQQEGTLKTWQPQFGSTAFL